MSKNAMPLDGEWFELMDHQNGRIFYANPTTGECTWTRPVSGIIKPKDPNGEWWELYDDTHDRLYYYNSATKQTDWIRPEVGTIVPLTGIQLCLMKLSLVGLEGQEDYDSTASMNSSNLAETARPASHSTLPSSKKSKSSTFSSSPSTSPSTSASASLSPSPSSPSSLPKPKASLSPQPMDISSDSEPSPTVQQRHASPGTPPRLASLSPTRSSMAQVERSVSPERDTGVVSLSPIATSTPRKRLSPALPTPTAANLSSLSSPDSAKSARPKTFLPESLKNDITLFMIDGFAAKYFATHKKGIFNRKKVPLEVMICWTKDNLDNPLMVLNKHVHKEALKCFKQIQRVMGDRPHSNAKASKANGSEEIRYLLEAGINHGELRDEIYVQLCKQLSNNPSMESVRKGWEIMCVICLAFPPSKNFEDYLKTFMSRHQHDSDDKVATMACYATRKLEKTIRVGPRGKTPSMLEIDRAREAPFSQCLFGETLDDIMAAELARDPSATVPRILTFLTESILSLQGQRSEGIFRVPGDAECVTELKIRVERGNYDLQGVTDPNVPASLLKLWLRELSDPLIPMSIYDSCIKSFDHPERALSVLQRLSQHHAAVTKFMIEFLQIIALPDNEPYTKMSTSNLAMVFAPNFLRCPSDDPAIIFANTIFEQGFLRTLLLNYRKA